MNQNLYWKPGPVCRLQKSLDNQLRDVLLNKSGIFDRDQRALFTEDHRRYLEGLRDANVVGAQDLLDAITTCKDVEVFIE